MPRQSEDRRPATEWLGWHLVELLVATGGLALAVAVAPWLIVLTVLAGGVWARAERHARHTRRQLAASQPRPVVPAARPETETETDDEMTREGVAR